MDDDKARYEALTARLYTRESSTLTITTFTAVAALTFLAIVAQLNDIRLYVLGILFVGFGVLYRELTVHTVDRADLQVIRQIERSHGYLKKLTRPEKLCRFVRWFIFRCAVVTPAVGLIRFWAILDQWLPMWWIFYPVCISAYPLIASAAEYYIVDRDC
jgi:hypothetical protein